MAHPSLFHSLYDTSHIRKSLHKHISIVFNQSGTQSGPIHWKLRCTDDVTNGGKFYAHVIQAKKNSFVLSSLKTETNFHPHWKSSMRKMFWIVQFEHLSLLIELKFNSNEFLGVLWRGNLRKYVVNWSDFRISHFQDGMKVSSFKNFKTSFIKVISFKFIYPF